jgi:hypothetical protein
MRHGAGSWLREVFNGLKNITSQAFANIPIPAVVSERCSRVLSALLGSVVWAGALLSISHQHFPKNF